MTAAHRPTNVLIIPHVCQTVRLSKKVKRGVI